MLISLTIKNFALIDTSSLELGAGLNILTGETGAGKSIVIDAMRFALGEGMESTLVRDDQEDCSVEAVFDLSHSGLLKNPLFNDYISEHEPDLIISRIYTPDSRSKIKVNGFSVTLGQLKELGDHLVDIHGPHDHQQLLSPASHLEILDSLSNLGDNKKRYQHLYLDFENLKNKLADLQAHAQTRERELDLLTHQIKELEALPLNRKKYEEVSGEQARINNLGALFENASSIINALENEDSGIIDTTRKTFNAMHALNRMDKDTEKFSRRLTEILEHGQQLMAELRMYIDSLSFEPNEVEKINATCDIYNQLLRKYGPQIENAAEFYKKAKERFEFYSNMEHNDFQLRSQIETLRLSLTELAQKLSNQRKHSALALQKTIEKELSELGINGVKFQCQLEQGELNKNGQDIATFFISPNPGEPLKPLAEIVSSGEAARVMLALKKALINVDPIPVLVFDEIDAQIGGRLGSVTGKKLKEIASKRQVILITHLPQIASFANLHFKVTKSVKAGRTSTVIEKLGPHQRVDELAKMMSGEKASTISLTHAKDMLKEGQK